MIFVFIITQFFSNSFAKEKYQIVNTVWRMKAPIAIVKNELGEPQKITQTEILYFEVENFPEIQLSLNNNKRVSKAYMSINRNKIDEFKKYIPCEWVEKRDVVYKGDLILDTHQGKCLTLPIRFEFDHNFREYQISWE